MIISMTALSEKHHWTMLALRVMSSLRRLYKGSTGRKDQPSRRFYYV
jgi:hypothetical protein